MPSHETTANYLVKVDAEETIKTGSLMDSGRMDICLYYAERPKNDLLQLNVATPILDRGWFFFLHNLPQDLSISSVFYAKESASSQMPGFFEETGTG